MPASLYLVLRHLRLPHSGTPERKESLATFPLPALPIIRTQAACKPLKHRQKRTQG